MLVQKELKEAYIGIPNPTSIVLDKSSISLTTIGQTEQLTATIEPTISDHSITWSSDDTTVATVVNGLVTCVTPGTCTITATTVNGLTDTCSVDDNQGWQPGANTIAYYPLDTDFNDASGNSRNLINSGATITSLGGVACGYWNGSATAYYQGYSITRDERTISARVNGHMINDNVCVQIAKKDVALRGSLTTVFYGGNIFIADNYSKGTASYSATADTRYYVVGTQEGNTVKFYVNGNLYDTVTTRPVYQSAPDGWSLGSQYNSGAGAKLNGYMSNVILEDKTRTAQEIADYYDLTKYLYGIS